MKKRILKIPLLFILFSVKLFSVKTYADDIWFLSLGNNQPVTGTIQIQIQTYHPVPVRIWIEDDKTKMLVWWATISPEENYTVSVDTTKFIPGKYEIKAVYFFENEEYEGDIDIWVNRP